MVIDGNTGGSGTPGSPPKNVNLSTGDGKGSGTPGSPDKSKTDSNVEFETYKKEQENKVSDLSNQLKNALETIGRMGDEVGQLRQSSQQNVSIEEYAKGLHKKIFDSDDPLEQMRGIATFVMDTVSSVDMKRRNAMVSHSKVMENEKNNDVSWSDVEYYATTNDIPLDNIGSFQAMRKVVNDLRIVRNAKRDIAAEAKTMAEGMFDEWKKQLHPANTGSPTHGEPPKPIDVKDHDAKRARSAVAAQFGIAE